MTGIKYVCLQKKKLKVISEGFFPSLCTLLEGQSPHIGNIREYSSVRLMFFKSHIYVLFHNLK